MLNYFRKKKIGLLVVVGSTMMAGSGCGSGTGGANVAIDGITGPTVSFVNNKMTMSVVFNNVSFDGGVTLPIPKLPNSYVEVGPDFQSNGLLLSVGLDVNDIAALTKGGVVPLDPLTLPGGRPLPGVAAGYLPGIAVSVPKLDNIAFYVGPTVFGAFVPVNLPWTGIVGTFRFYDASHNPIGNLSIVGSDTNKKNSGFLLLIDLKGKVASLVNAARK